MQVARGGAGRGRARVPKTSSGKVQRRACRAAVSRRASWRVVGAQPPGSRAAASGRASPIRPEALPGLRRTGSRRALRRRGAASTPGAGRSGPAARRPRARLAGRRRAEAARSRRRLGVALSAGGPAGRRRPCASSQRRCWPSGGDRPARPLRAGAGEAPAGEHPALLRASGRSGSSTGWRRRARPTTSPARRGCAAQLDAAALGRALQGLVDRHPALRTTFAEHAPAGRCSACTERRRTAFEIVDAAGWSDAEARARACTRRPAARSTSRPARSCGRPCCGAAGEAVLVLAVHHIVGRLLVAGGAGRASSARSAARSGGARACRPPALRYADFVRWQEELLAGPAGERLWELLARARSPASCRCSTCPPTGRGRRCRPCAAAARRCRLGRSGRRRSRGARPPRTAATLFMALLAAFQAAARTATAARRTSWSARPPPAAPRRELAGVVGYFVNPVVLRADLARRSDVRRAARRGRGGTVLGAFEHQDFPFAAARRAAAAASATPAGRRCSRSMFAFEKAPRAGARGARRPSRSARPGVRLELGRAEPGVARPGAARGAVRPRPCWRPSCRTALGRLAAVQRRPVRRRDRRPPGRATSSGCSPRPWRRRSCRSRSCRCSPRRSATSSLAEWNDTAAPSAAASRCSTSCFEAQAARTPEAAGRRLRRRGALTYGELDRAGRPPGRATCARSGVGPESRVGVCLERSLGPGGRPCSACSRPAAPTCRSIPAYPRERLAFMLEDAGAAGADHRRSRCRRAAGSARAAVVCLDERAARTADARPLRPCRRRRQPRLRDLHLGLDRPAQGGGGPPPRRSSTACAAIGARLRLRPSGRRARRPPRSASTSRSGRSSLPLLRRPAASIVPPRGGAGRRAALAAAARRERRHGAAGDPARPGGRSCDAALAAEPPALRGCSCGGEALPREPGRALLAAARRPRAGQPLRPDRDARSTSHLLPLRRGAGDRRRCRSAGRSPTPASTCSTAALQPVPVGRAGRAVHRRRRPGARLSRPAGPDGRALRAGPVRRRAGSAPLPHRRPGALPARRRRRVPRPPRPPGQDPRLPHRAGRDRGGAGRAARGPRGGRAGARGHARRPAAGRLRGRRRRGRASCASALRERLPELHGARRLRDARGAAAHPQRQGGPQGPAGAGVAGRRGELPGAAHAGRGGPRRHLGRGPRRSSGSGRPTTSSTWAATRCWRRR